MSAEAACLKPSPCQGSASCQRIWGTGSGPRGVCSGPHFNPWLLSHHPAHPPLPSYKKPAGPGAQPVPEEPSCVGARPHPWHRTYLAHRGAAPGLWPLWKEGKVQLDHDKNYCRQDYSWGS